MLSELHLLRQRQNALERNFKLTFSHLEPEAVAELAAIDAAADRARASLEASLKLRLDAARRAASAVAAHAAAVQPGPAYLSALDGLVGRAERELSSARARADAPTPQSTSACCCLRACSWLWAGFRSCCRVTVRDLFTSGLPLWSLYPYQRRRSAASHK